MFDICFALFTSTLYTSYFPTDNLIGWVNLISIQ